MAVSDWSTTASANSYLGTIDLRESFMVVGDVNNAFREMMAQIKVFYNSVPVAADYVTKTGGVFTGNPTFTGRGGYLHHNNSALTGGRVFMQASGGSTPSGMAAGDILLEY